ncbi:MAG: M23 family metallopeptidase [Vicinamibacterales bacterium]
MPSNAPPPTRTMPLRALFGFLVLLAGAEVHVGSQPETTELEVAVSPRAVPPGGVVRVHVVCRCGGTPPRVVTALGNPAMSLASGHTEASPQRWQGLVGIDLDTRPGIYNLEFYDTERGATSRTVALHVVPKSFATRRLQVAPNFVEPSAPDVARIVKEAAALDALFKTMTPRHWNGAFMAPVATGPTSNFGTRSVFNGELRSPHAGVDFRAATGTPIVAPAAGRVALAGDLFFTGQTVVIDHGSGLLSLMAHLSSIAVSPDTLVSRGARIGRVGATGRVTGPHLHWSVRLNGARVDPLSLLSATRESGV